MMLLQHTLRFFRNPGCVRLAFWKRRNLGLRKRHLVVAVLATQSCLTLCHPRTVAHQAPLSTGFSRQGYWSGLPRPSVFLPGELYGWGAWGAMVHRCFLWDRQGRAQGQSFNKTQQNPHKIESPQDSGITASAYNAGDPGSIPGSGSSPGGQGTPLQCSCLESPVDGGAWWATVPGVEKSPTRLSDSAFTFHGALETEVKGQGRDRLRVWD